MKRGTPLRRTPLAARGAKADEADAMNRWHDAVMARCWFRCWFERHPGYAWEHGLGPCQGRLHAHHVAQRSTHPERRTDPTNGQVLCQLHHTWVHAHPALATELGLLERATT